MLLTFIHRVVSSVALTEGSGAEAVVLVKMVFI
jgi:hypothetical protein